MDLEKQKILISAILSSRELMALTCAIIKPSYFDPSLKKSVNFIVEYFNKFRDIPPIPVVRAETGAIYESLGAVDKAESAWASGEIETFCRNKAVEAAILAGPELLQKGEMGKIIENLKSAINVGLHTEIGIEYFKNVEERLYKTLETQAKVSTGWPEVDILLGGGLSRQELITFLANSGGGKSMTMLNLGHNLLKQGLNGVYITLEMAEGIVTKRLDSMVSHISQANLLKETKKVADSINNAGAKYGQFFVKRFPENRTNIHHIRAYLEELNRVTGFKPDFIIVDYLDIMGTTMSISLDNLFVKDKYVTEEIRSLGYDYDAIIISAAQLGRNAIEAENLNQGHIQGGISKINTSDYVVAVKQDELMRSAGEIWFELLKARNSEHVGKKQLLGWDGISLTIKSMAGATLQLNKKSGPVASIKGTIFDKKTKNPASVLDLV